MKEINLLVLAITTQALFLAHSTCINDGVPNIVFEDGPAITEVDEDNPTYYYVNKSYDLTLCPRGYVHLVEMATFPTTITKPKTTTQNRKTDNGNCVELCSPIITHTTYTVPGTTAPELTGRDACSEPPMMV